MRTANVSRALWIAAAFVGLATTTMARADAGRCIASAEKAQRLRKDGHLRASREELVVCANEACPAAIASDCKRWLAEVDAAQPSVVVRALDGGGAEVFDVQVSVDGTPVATRLDGRALPIDPGEHTMQYERAGAPQISEHVVVREGERDRVLTATFASPAPSRHGIPLATWVLGAAGIVSAGVGVTFWVLGTQDRNDLYASCGATRVCSSSDESPAKTKLLVGDIAVGVGVLALGAATWFALSSRDGTASVQAQATPGGALLGGRVVF